MLNSVLTWSKYFFAFQLLVLICGKTIPRNEPIPGVQEFVPHIPEECLEGTMCEHVSNYPKKHVFGLLTKLMEKTNRTVKPINKTQKMGEIHSFEDEGAELELCESEVTEIIPQAARGVDGYWYFILNHEDLLVQKLTAVNCKYRTNKKDTGCADYVFFQGTYPQGKCLQKQSKVKLMAVGRYGLEEKKIFEINSCCSCVAAHKLVIS